MPIKDIPAEARPREKLLSRGPGALSDIELLAILLRTGIQGKGVLQMAEELLQLKNDSAPLISTGVLAVFQDYCTPPLMI
jgi:DNA repair protein RadC